MPISPGGYRRYPCRLKEEILTLVLECWLTPTEAADQFKVPRSTINSWRRRATASD